VGDGTDDATTTFRGVIASINGALDGMRFDPTPAFIGPASVRIQTSDLGHSGSGGELSDDDTLVINVVAAVDLQVSKSINIASPAPGERITYTLVVTNAGPSNASGITLIDTLPTELSDVTWQCAVTGGATCPNTAGSGDISETIDMPKGSTVVFTVDGTIAQGTTSLSNTVSATAPAGVTELNPDDNSATVDIVLEPKADLSIEKSSSRSGADVIFTVLVRNLGPSNTFGATVSDPVPAGLSGFSGGCETAGGATCSWSGSGAVNDTVNLPVGGLITYTLTSALVSQDPVTNTATVSVPPGVPDPVPDNNTAAVFSGHYVYLGMITKGFLTAPDLVVDDVDATSNGATVTIRNVGTATVTDEFWVDLYFNPSQLPSLNHPWDTIANQGAVWGVTQSLIPGQVLVLSTDAGDPYYHKEHSSKPPFPVGATVYALVDSVCYETAYGAVQESNEGNNLSDKVISTVSMASQHAVADLASPPSLAGLPER
jgi:uncharacterized repeat protein (TIGR01451 family)